MKRSFKNFKKLSAKQIKTYAAVILMSTLSFEAIASVESGLNEQLYIEDWMHTPFELSMDEVTAMETPVFSPSETVVEMELVIESWMIVPFKTNFVEESPIENSICNPAP